MGPAVRMELHLSLIQSRVLGTIEVQLTFQVDQEEKHESRTAISPDQLFTRLQEVVNNQLRVAALEMEKQIKKQRIAK